MAKIIDREILFRGKYIHALSQNEHLDETWVYGYLCDENYINLPELEGEFLVDPESVCQYTGTPDKNSKKIFEGDIVRRKIFEKYIVGQVVWLDIGFCGFYLKHENRYYPIGKNEHTGISDEDEVIGNIFDNPGLLKIESAN